MVEKPILYSELKKMFATGASMCEAIHYCDMEGYVIDFNTWYYNDVRGYSVHISFSCGSIEITFDQLGCFSSMHWYVETNDDELGELE